MKYNHALFLNPYIERSVTSAMKMFPPTGLEYVAAGAVQYVTKLTLLDLRYEEELSDINKLLEFIAQEIDIVCVGIGWDRQLKEIYGLLNAMPENIPLVVGGYTATEKVEEIFADCPKVKVVVRGEGEETIKEILAGAAMDTILGVSYRKNGEIVHNANRPLPDVKDIVPPDRGLRRSEYRLTLNGVSIAGLTFDTVLSSRGCPYHCKFCTFTLNPLGQKRNYSARAAESVVDEIAGTSAKIILFSDENFCVDARRAEKICDLIIARKIKKRFAAQVRLDIAKYPVLLEKMVKAGFKALLLGIESPHDRILAQLNKGFNSAEIRKAFAVLRKYPIFYHGYFIYGNIGETEEEMLSIPRFAREIGVDSITFLKLRIEKFSPLKELALNTPGYHITEDGKLYSDAYPMAALKRIGRRIKFAYYTPPQFMKMLWKLQKIHFFRGQELVSLVTALPLILGNVIKTEFQKGRLAESLRRTFISNR